MQKDQVAAPLVSVIMPAYNAARFIEEAIMSVIAQTVSDWELIVIDDCSQDNTRDIIAEMAEKDSRILFVANEQNMGVAKTRNRGLDMCRGQYVAFLDSDDYWQPEKLQKQLDKMQAADAGICYCSYKIIDAFGAQAKADYIVPEKASFEDILTENFIQCSAMLIRADIVKRFRFNTEFFHEDYILGLDMLRAGEKAVGCSELLLNWRYLENSRSFNKKKSAVNRWKIYRNYLQLPLCKAVWVFVGYAFAGLRKYR